MATLQAARAQIAPARSLAETPQLRLLTCGSVDDGKSTLLGRLLFDAHAVLDDQLEALDGDSRRWGTDGAARDYALLLDGLSAEREQGITIDVAYRYFSTPRRSFIVADTPGHEQYTRNMATGASQADLAIILVDARKGILPQTRRHAFIVATLGIRHAVLAINKMDLVDFSQSRFREIADAFAALALPLGLQSITAIPLVARDGDNIASDSPRMPWYAGPTLLEHLETVDVTNPDAEDTEFRFPVQLVLRPDADFRGYAGTIASGTVRPGDAVLALPSRTPAHIARIVTATGDRASAGPGDAVTLTLDREIDLARGDVLATPTAPAPSQTLRATVLWMAETPLDPTREYLLQLGPSVANARLARLHHATDIETYAAIPATTLALNGIGLADFTLDRPLATTPFAENRTLGAFILVDRQENATVAMGTIQPTLNDAISDRAPSCNPAAAEITTAGLARAGIAGACIATLTCLLSADPRLAAALGFANILLSLVLERAKTPNR